MQNASFQRVCPYRPFGALRFLLAVLVMIQHFGSSIVPEPVRAAIYPLAVGTVAVMVFFVLSGFIIAEAVHCNYQSRPGAFLFNRFLRIVPPLVIAISLSAVVHFLLLQRGQLIDLDGLPRGSEIFTGRELGLNMLSFLPGLREAGLLPDYSFFPYIWAIRAEVLFYFAMFAALAAAGWGMRFVPRTCVARVSVWLTLAGCGAIALTGGSLAGILPDLLAFGAYFTLGAAYFYAVNGRRAAALFLPVCLALIALQYKDTHLGKVLAYPQDMVFQFALLAGLLALVGVCAVAQLRSRRLLAIDRFLGEMSFPLYLYHYPVGIVFASLFAGAHSALSAWAAGAISCGVAVVMYYAVEPPLRRVRNRVRGQVIVLDQGLSAVARRDAQQDRQRVEA